MVGSLLLFMISGGILLLALGDNKKNDMKNQDIQPKKSVKELSDIIEKNILEEKKKHKLKFKRQRKNGKD